MIVFSPFSQVRPLRRDPNPAFRVDTPATRTDDPRDLCELSSSAAPDEKAKTRQAAILYGISSLSILTGLAGIAAAAPGEVTLVAYAVGAASLVSGLMIDGAPFR